MNYPYWQIPHNLQNVQNVQHVPTRVNDDDDNDWPELVSADLEEPSEQKNPLQPQVSQFHADSPSSSGNHVPQQSLNYFDYPKLGESFTKRKHPFPERSQLSIVNRYSNRTDRYFGTVSSTMDLIEADIKKTSQEKWPASLLASHGSKFAADVCKLQANMFRMQQPLITYMLAMPKKRVAYVARKKKPSKLKGLILLERMTRKQAKSRRRKICEVMVNPSLWPSVSMLNLSGLRINVADDGDLLKKMSALSCMGSSYRNTPAISIAEDNVIFRPDLHKEMENMSIEFKNESKESEEENEDTVVCNAGFVDLETVEATERLKISEETGESVDNALVKVDGVKFTNKYREYCTNIVTSNLKSCLDDFLIEMARLQKKMYARDKVKGRYKRRYYAGIKEVGKHVDLKKIKFVIVATDLEKVQAEGGLDDSLNELIGLCKKYEIPHCFGLGRRKLGYFTHGKGFASCIGIANYSGAEEKLKNVLCAVVEARNEFFRLMNNDGKIIDVQKVLPKEELLLSKMINAYLRIIASTN